VHSLRSSASATVEYNRYKRAANLDRGAITMSASPDWISARGGGYGGHRDEAMEAQQYVAEGKKESADLLRQAVRWLRDEIGDASEETAPAAGTEAAPHACRERSSSSMVMMTGHAKQ